MVLVRCGDGEVLSTSRSDVVTWRESMGGSALLLSAQFTKAPSFLSPREGISADGAEGKTPYVTELEEEASTEKGTPFPFIRRADGGK